MGDAEEAVAANGRFAYLCALAEDEPGEEGAPIGRGVGGAADEAAEGGVALFAAGVAP